MTDLELNIALAEAIGWQPSSKYAVMYGQYELTRCFVYCNDNGTLRKFDYKDPVIFAAICKQFDLNVYYGFCNVSTCFGVERYGADTIEKAAALCVIASVKRGVK